MFLDEANIASRIRHPNVANIVDLGEEGDSLFMVLEWVNGDSWSKLAAAIAAAGHALESARCSASAPTRAPGSTPPTS